MLRDFTIGDTVEGHKISAIMTDYTGNTRHGDANAALLDALESSSQFTIGLGVAYDPDGILNKASSVSSIRAGRRAPDVLVRKPGSRLPTRLYGLTKNNGKFWIVVLASEPLRTAQSLKALKNYFNSAESLMKQLVDAFLSLTFIASTGMQPGETLGVAKFGRAYYDVDHTAFARYRASTTEGGGSA